jgi:hypothetical protein
MIGKIPMFIAVIRGTAAGAIQFYMEIQPEQILMRVTSNILDSRRIKALHALALCASVPLSSDQTRMVLSVVRTD